jgi:hypothetical protein
MNHANAGDDSTRWNIITAYKQKRTDIQPA